MRRPLSLGLVLVSAALVACGTRESGSDAQTSASASPASSSFTPGKWPIVEIDKDGNVLLDGSPVGTSEQIVREKRIMKLDDLFTGLKKRRAADSATADAGDPFGFVCGLRAAPNVSNRVFKSAFQTIVFAGYPRITLQIASERGSGESKLYDLVGMVPGWSASVTPSGGLEKWLDVVPGAGLDYTLTWKQGAVVVATDSLTSTTVGILCDSWRKHGAHMDADDALADVAVVHARDEETVEGFLPALDLIGSCERERAGHGVGPAFSVTFSIR